MKTYNAKVISEGICVGPVFKLEFDDEAIKDFQGIDKELEMLDSCISKSAQFLKSIHDSLLTQSNTKQASIINVQHMMINDEVFVDSIKNRIMEDHQTVREAILNTKDEFVSIFQNMDEYMAQRANDILEISSLLLSQLSDKSIKVPDEPSIFFTDNLSCNDIYRFDQNLVLGFVTDKGFEMSHAAILVKNEEIPTVYGINDVMDFVENGDTVVINNDELIINPDDDVIKDIEKKIIENEDRKLELKKFRDLKPVTKDGRHIEVFANISSSLDLNKVIENHIQGVGLCRSEFFFLDKMVPPTEEEQYLEYKSLLETLENRVLIIRTIDVGSDKQVNFIDYGEEKNPSLGKRGIRVYYDEVDLFQTQLRALLRAAPYGNLRIMYPMIISADDINFIKEQFKIVESELIEDGVEYSVPPQGIMIETPAAALISDELAKLVDFFSIGTNDLTQYTLALDRENYNISRHMDVMHPAIFKQIELCVKNAHDNGITCSICGEIAENFELTERFLDMGVDMLSLSPNKVLELISKIRSF